MTEFDEEEFVKKSIEKFLHGSDFIEWEWDDFLHEKLKDGYMKSIQSICINLPYRFPPDNLTKNYCGPYGDEILEIILKYFFNR